MTETEHDDLALAVRIIGRAAIGAFVAVAVLLAIVWLIQPGDPPLRLVPPLAEDDPGWDCRFDGNRDCGPAPLPGPTGIVGR